MHWSQDCVTAPPLHQHFRYHRSKCLGMKLLSSVLVFLCVAQAHGSPTKMHRKCMKQPYIGSCHPLYGLWYYDPNRYSCRELTQALTLAKAKICLKLPIEGPCGPLYVSWYYDYEGHHCKMFNRTICGGGGNDFVTEAKCQAMCLHMKAATGSLTTAGTMQNQQPRLNKTGKSTPANLALTT
ncbi:uncharacterized protein LOC142587152 [Dermacentor variabilis]|uniref:uncharacterized protein LOC142587152 n=1 Tax=Dermacentor variabilis TaxID=34621 RepID=UPI003F5BAAFC